MHWDVVPPVTIITPSLQSSPLDLLSKMNEHIQDLTNCYTLFVFLFNLYSFLLSISTSILRDNKADNKCGCFNVLCKTKQKKKLFFYSPAPIATKEKREKKESRIYFFFNLLFLIYK